MRNTSIARSVIKYATAPSGIIGRNFIIDGCRKHEAVQSEGYLGDTIYTFKDNSFIRLYYLGFGGQLYQYGRYNDDGTVNPRTVRYA